MELIWSCTHLLQKIQLISPSQASLVSRQNFLLSIFFQIFFARNYLLVQYISGYFYFNRFGRVKRISNPVKSCFPMNTKSHLLFSFSVQLQTLKHIPLSLLLRVLQHVLHLGKSWESFLCLWFAFPKCINKSVCWVNKPRWISSILKLWMVLAEEYWGSLLQLVWFHFLSKIHLLKYHQDNLQLWWGWNELLFCSLWKPCPLCNLSAGCHFHWWGVCVCLCVCERLMIIWSLP